MADSTSSPLSERPSQTKDLAGAPVPLQDLNTRSAGFVPGSAPSTTASSCTSKLHSAISARLETSRPMVRSSLLAVVVGAEDVGSQADLGLRRVVSTRILPVLASAWSPLR